MTKKNTKVEIQAVIGITSTVKKLELLINKAKDILENGFKKN
jgi:hypothetical protein